jgi:hypothetical protein
LCSDDTENIEDRSISVDYLKIQVEDMGKVSGEGYSNL